MRRPVGAERAVGSGKGVQSSDEAVLLAFSLLFLTMASSALQAWLLPA